MSCVVGVNCAGNALAPWSEPKLLLLGFWDIYCSLKHAAIWPFCFLIPFDRTEVSPSEIGGIAKRGQSWTNSIIL